MNRLTAMAVAYALLGASPAWAVQKYPVGDALNNPSVQQAITELTSPGRGSLGYRQIQQSQSLISGQCGFAGCSATFLVVFTFESAVNVNATTKSVIATVSYGPTGGLSKVSLVKTIPLKTEVDTDADNPYAEP